MRHIRRRAEGDGSAFFACRPDDWRNCGGLRDTGYSIFICIFAAGTNYYDSKTEKRYESVASSRYEKPAHHQRPGVFGHTRGHALWHLARGDAGAALCVVALFQNLPVADLHVCACGVLASVFQHVLAVDVRAHHRDGLGLAALPAVLHGVRHRCRPLAGGVPVRAALQRIFGRAGAYGGRFGRHLRHFAGLWHDVSQ